MEVDLNLVDSLSAELIDEAVLSTQSLLTGFASDPIFFDSVRLAFGDLNNSEKVESLRQQWVTGNFEGLPKVEIRPADEINGANGAFSRDTNTIYLSQNYLAQNTSNLRAITNVLLEEIGHFVDAKINSVDASGDEGAIFSALAQDLQLGESALQALKAEDDTAAIVLDGQVTNVEQSTTYTGDNLATVISGLDGFLNTVQGAINTQVFGSNLPLFNNKLTASGETQFINNLRTSINTALKGLDVFTPEKIQQTLASVVGLEQATLINQTADEVKFNLKLGSGSTFSSSLKSSLGLSGLGLDINGNAQVNLGYNLNLAFGINKTKGFFIDTSAIDELKFNLNASLPGLNATSKLGFLNFNVTDQNSQFNGDFAIDLQDSNADGNIASSEITTQQNATADVNLHLKSNSDLVGLPSISSDLNLDWSLNDKPTVAFNNVKLDMGSFFNNFTKPILGKIQQVTEPIQPFINLLDKQIPGLSDLEPVRNFFDVNSDGKVTLIDLAKKLQPNASYGFLDAVVEVSRLANSIPTDVKNLAIDLGSFNLGDTNLNSTRLANATINVTQGAAPIATQLQGRGAAESFYSRLTSSPAGGLNFPILNDPSVAFKLLLGQDANLFTYQMPKLNFEVGFDQKFPIIQPLFVGFGGNLGATVNSLGFGFDTLGLHSGKTEDVFNGFYISDRANPDGSPNFDGGGADVPEVTLNGNVSLFGEVDVIAAKGRIEGGINGKVNFDLYDTKDGKVRAKDFLNAPLFKTSGELNAGLYGSYVIGKEPFIISEGKYGFGEIKLADFNSDYQSPKIELAQNIGSNQLQLNVGPNASDRREINTTDGDEVFIVERKSGLLGNEIIWVSGFNFTKEYSGFSKITANGGEGKDTIFVSAGVLTATELFGGNGDDKLLGGNGNDLLQGDNGNDYLAGGEGNDKLYGSDGDDKLFGHAGNDEIYSGLGDDHIQAGAGDDWIVDQLLGNDKMWGESGNDKLFSGVGDDYLEGGLGQDILDGGLGREQIWGGDDSDTLFGGADYDSMDGQAGSDLLFGGSGNDLIRGGEGNDRLYAGGGEGLEAWIQKKVASGELSADTVNTNFQKVFEDYQKDLFYQVTELFGDTSLNNLFGDEGNDLLFGAPNYDELNGGSGNDVLHGSTGEADDLDGKEGNDFLFGGYGLDRIYGGIGNDILFASGGDLTSIGIMLSEQIFKPLLVADESTKQTLISNLFSTFSSSLFRETDRNKLFGEDGNDWLLGAAGNDEFTGGSGNDILHGSAGDESSTESATIGKPMEGNEGDDLMIGGDGSDELLGGTSNDTLIAGGGNLETSALQLIERLHKGESIQTLQASAPDVFFGETTSNTLSGEEGNDLLLGAAGIDQLIGGTDNDTLHGSAGDELNISGDEGDDLLFGGDGSDTLYGRQGNDTMFAGGGDLKAAAAQIISQLQNGVSVIELASNQANALFQETNSNSLWGDEGNDTLYGAAGNDTLVGGSGYDTLTGGAGTDSFEFYASNEESGTITDFSTVDDLLKVSAAGFGGGLVAGAAITTDQFTLGSSATNAAHRFIYDNSNGALYFDVDGRGGTEQVEIAVLSTLPGLSNNNIFVLA